MRDQKVKEGEAEEKNKAEVEAQTATQVAEVVVEMGQEFLRPIVKKTEFCRWVLSRNTIPVKGVGQSWSLGEGTGELLLKMRSLERGGLEGKRVILLVLLLVLSVDKDLKGRIIHRRRRTRRLVWCWVEILRKVGVFLGKGRRG